MLVIIMQLSVFDKNTPPPPPPPQKKKKKKKIYITFASFHQCRLARLKYCM